MPETQPKTESHVRGVMAVQKILNTLCARTSEQQRANAERIIDAYLEAAKPEPVGEIELTVISPGDANNNSVVVLDQGCFKYCLDSGLTLDGAHMTLSEAESFFREIGLKVRVIA